MNGGNWNKILFIDLSSKEISVEQAGDDLYSHFLGGYGLGARIIYSRQKAGVDPLSPENVLGFTTGVLVGTPVVGASRFTVCGKSPLTLTWGDANCGGHFGPALKKAGFDAMFFTGAAKEPVYLFMEDGYAELRSAKNLWGRDTFEVEEALKGALGEEVQVASIGPAGEKLSLIASIIHDKGRAAARSGLGAVMGAKRLKAIAVRGTLSVPLVAERRVKALRERCLQELNSDSVRYFRKYGTVNHVASSAFSGDSPVRNWAGVGLEDFPSAEAISDDNVIKYEVKKYACYRCPIACGGIYRVENGPYLVKETQKPEYETVAMFGNNCLNDDMESIIKANELCNRYGLDTISTGGVVAFAIECYENGLLSSKETGGLKLAWGDHEAIVAVTEQIARREGVGALLADGVKAAVERIGRAAEEYAIHVGGQELAAHDPRYAPSFAVNHVVDATPGRHTQFGLALIELGVTLKGINIPESDKYQLAGKGALNARLLDLMQAVFSCGVCSFVFQRLDVRVWPEFISAATGWEYTWKDLLTAGARIGALRQAFNLREGIPVADFRLPGRAYGQPPMERGPLAGVTIDVETQMRETYQARGWDPDNGEPLKGTLIELGLNDVADDLYG